MPQRRTLLVGVQAGANCWGKTLWKLLTRTSSPAPMLETLASVQPGLIISASSKTNPSEYGLTVSSPPALWTFFFFSHGNSIDRLIFGLIQGSLSTFFISELFISWACLSLNLDGFLQFTAGGNHWAQTYPFILQIRKSRLKELVIFPRSVFTNKEVLRMHSEVDFSSLKVVGQRAQHSI